MDDRRKHARAMHQKINRVLQNEWDPIGVADVPEAQDEYESYVPQIYAMLIRGRPVREIFDYLWRAETQHMGLCGNQQRTMHIAETLAALQSRPE